MKLAQLASFESKNTLNYQLKNEVSWANFKTYKIICNWQPFMNRVYGHSGFENSNTITFSTHLLSFSITGILHPYLHLSASEVHALVLNSVVND